MKGQGQETVACRHWGKQPNGRNPVEMGREQKQEREGWGGAKQAEGKDSCSCPLVWLTGRALAPGAVGVRGLQQPAGSAVGDRALSSAHQGSADSCFALPLAPAQHRAGCPGLSWGTVCADVRAQHCISYQSLRLGGLRKISRGCKCR